MAELRRQFQYSAKGPMGNDEDWWHLVFDPVNRSICVEHEWDHVPLSGGKSSKGTERLSIDEFLGQSYNAPQHRNLIELLRTLFDDSEGAGGT